MTLDLVGVGNAIMDALVRLDDENVLAELGVIRGQMTPVDHHRWHQVYERVHSQGIEIHSGGSCANSIATAGILGGKVLYCGQIADDIFGTKYAESLGDACGGHALQVVDGAVSGKCLSLISKKDGERTMLTDLGTSVNLRQIGSFAEQIRHSKVLHVEGYHLLGGPVKEAVQDAMAVARKAGVAVSLDVADPFVAHTCRDEIIALLQSGAIQIGFFNREEAEVITGKGAYAALEDLAKQLDIAVVKLGAEGSLVSGRGETHKIPGFPIEVLDTTGAGDAYAGAFLYAHAQNWSLDRCGELGSRVASLTVGQVGAVCRNRIAMQAAVRAVEAR